MSFREWMNRYALSKQIMLMLTASLVILLIVVSFVISIIVRHSRATSAQLINNSLRLMGATIEYNLENMRSIVDYIALQPDLNNFLKETDPEEKYDYYTQMNSTLKGALSLNRDIIDIFVLDESTRQIYANSSTAALSLPDLGDITEEGMAFLPSLEMIIMTQPITDPLENSIRIQRNGYLAALLDPAFLTASSNDIIADGLDMYLLSDEGDIIWQSSEGIDEEGITAELPEDMTLGIIAPSAAYSPVNPYNAIAISLALIFGLFLIAMIWIAGIRNIVMPIQRFTALIRSMRKEHATPAKLGSAYPEMRMLESEFIRLTERSEQLTEELIEANSKLYQ